MHRITTSTLRSVVSELLMSLYNVLAWYGTFSTHFQTAYQSTVSSPKARTVLFSKTLEAYRTAIVDCEQNNLNFMKIKINTAPSGRAEIKFFCLELDFGIKREKVVRYENMHQRIWCGKSRV